MLMRIYRFLSTFTADRRGVTALEYALMGALIAVAICATVAGFGTRLSSTFNNISRIL